MGTLANIIEALRRTGGATTRSALKRQDEQLEGRTILGRRRARTKVGEESFESFLATVEASDEQVSELTPDEVRQLGSNAILIEGFLGRFHRESRSDRFAAVLDLAFRNWLSAGERHGWTDDKVINVVGAAFAEYCIHDLGMGWVKIRDAQGESLAIRGIECDVRALPFHAIAKRIRDDEHGFFAAIHATLKSSLSDPAYRTL